jgi:4-amino-4-deoxy-L-arabinose transferase-like glycosyltransferase
LTHPPSKVVRGSVAAAHTRPGASAALRWVGLVLALLVAAALRAAPLLDNRFHPDEALYASFGQRIAHGHNPLLSGVVVDKPPLPFYLLAVSLGAFGGGELAARLPNFYASLLCVALTYALGRRLYGTLTGLAAAWLLALSPFAILFSITVFIDPLLTAALLWAWWAAAADRPRLAALALALAFAIKQTALVFVPLALLLGLVRLPAAATPAAALRRLAQWTLPALVALGLTAGLVFAWDFVRQPSIGFWSQGYLDNVPGRFVRAGEVLPRARAWAFLLHYLTASTPVNLALLAGLAGLLVTGARRATRAGLADRLLMGFCLLYLAAYWLLAFNLWDRYLLPLVPLLAFLGARALRWVGVTVAHVLPGRRRAAWRAGLAVLLVALLAPRAAGAARSQFPIGGDHGAYDGIDGAAAFLRAQPAGTVLYDHWLSWEWGFYLYDGPVYVSWFPSPSELAVDLQAFGATSPRFLAIPAWEASAEIKAAVADAGFSLDPVYTAYRRDGPVTLVVYALRPTPHE